MLSFIAGKALIQSVFIISTEYCYNLSTEYCYKRSSCQSLGIDTSFFHVQSVVAL